jgi:hypothetical protein
VLGSLVAGVNFPYLACLAGLGAELPQSQYRWTHFVAGKAALRLLLPGRGYRQHPAIAWEGTSLCFLCHDPLPEVWGGCPSVVGVATLALATLYPHRRVTSRLSYTRPVCR